MSIPKWKNIENQEILPKNSENISHYLNRNTGISMEKVYQLQRVQIE